MELRWAKAAWPKCLCLKCPVYTRCQAPPCVLSMFPALTSAWFLSLPRASEWLRACFPLHLLASISVSRKTPGTIRWRTLWGFNTLRTNELCGRKERPRGLMGALSWQYCGDAPKTHMLQRCSRGSGVFCMCCRYPPEAPVSSVSALVPAPEPSRWLLWRWEGLGRYATQTAILIFSALKLFFTNQDTWKFVVIITCSIYLS